MTKIEWADEAWNPTTGCTKISAGCDNCYAERMAKRLKAIGVVKYEDGFEVRYHRESLGIPMKWKKPRRIFVNSMGDLFHKEIPECFINDVMQVMQQCTRHTYLVLTKRPREAYLRLSPYTLTDNVYIGTSVEDHHNLDRLVHLRATPAKRFISFEPLIARVGSIDLHGIRWVIVGGENGPGARPMKEEWAEEILDQCLEWNIPFFFKGHGSASKNKTKLLRGKTWEQFPKG